VIRQVGLIRCDKCDLPLAVSLGRSLQIGAVTLYCALRLECAKCQWGTWWHPAPREKRAGTGDDSRRQEINQLTR
jgi:hypothetical protein